MIRPLGEFMNLSFALNTDLFLLKHPFYQAWVEGRLSKEALHDYARQYYHHVEAFPGYLQNALALSPDEKTQTILEENLSEEDGRAYGISHPELWLRFAEGLGVSREDVRAAPLRSGIRNVVETFTASSKRSLPEALGGLYAYESQVPEIAHSKIEGLQRHFGIRDERTLAFFEVHKSADIQHRESLLQLIEELPEPQKAQAKTAADSASKILWDFLSDVYQENGCV
jgi:pyrroloquinoline-quinone synthase